jgi:hypothetical protein
MICSSINSIKKGQLIRIRTFVDYFKESSTGVGICGQVLALGDVHIVPAASNWEWSEHAATSYGFQNGQS